MSDLAPIVADHGLSLPQPRLHNGSSRCSRIPWLYLRGLREGRGRGLEKAKEGEGKGERKEREKKKVSKKVEGRREGIVKL